jgi:hypothetical protein
VLVERATDTLRADAQAFRASGVDLPEGRYLGPVLDTDDGLVQWGTELEFVIMVIAVSCVKLLSAHNSTQHTSRKHKV